jgi:ubiquinone/menaquinone biosynthesis C-methylase UbiE
MNTPPTAYHDVELQIALNPDSPHRVLPETEDAEAVLDIGCGAGQTLVAIGNHKRRVGVDIDVDALRSGLRTTVTSGICVAAAEGERLPFADGIFDFVYSRVALPYMDIPVALAEMHRVLRPRGRLWLTLHTIDIPAAQFRRGNFKGRIYAAYTVLNGLWFHVSGRTFHFLRGLCESIQTERGMRIALSRAGFSTIEFRRTTQHFAVTAQRLMPPAVDARTIPLPTDASSAPHAPVQAKGHRRPPLGNP